MRIDALHVSLTLLLGGAVICAPNAAPNAAQDPPAPAAAAASAAKAVDDAKPAQPAAGGSEQEMMAKIAAVGANHQFLAQLEGEWVGKCKMQLAPNAPAEEFTGKLECDMVLGGRFLRSKLKAKVGTNADKFEGFSMMGFDNVEQKFCAMWCDTWSTGFMPYSWGALDAATRTITLVRDCKDPMSGAAMKQREVHVIPNANEYKTEVFLTGPDGAEFKMFESTYTRAPAKPEKDKAKEKK